MYRSFKALLIFCCLIGAIGMYVVTRDFVIPLILCLVAVAVWAFGGSTLGSAKGLEGVKLDPARVKDYRRAHPGTDITEAARAVARGDQ